MTPEPEGVFLLNPRYPDKAPRLLQTESGPLHRFLDYIYVPRPVEELDTALMQVVNALRLRLVAGGFMSPVHAQVKTTMAAAVSDLEPRWVVEWGCGYDALDLRLTRATNHVAVDIDPAVVMFHRRLDQECFEPGDAELTQRYGETADVIVSVFVFHFLLTSEHIRTMASLLTARGLIVANVYRRREASRLQLVRAFEQAGFVVGRVPDPAQLCEGHEYWVMSRGRSAQEMEELLQRLFRGRDAPPSSPG